MPSSEISLTKELFSKRESFAKSTDSLYLQNGKINSDPI